MIPEVLDVLYENRKLDFTKFDETIGKELSRIYKHNYHLCREDDMMLYMVFNKVLHRWVGKQFLIRSKELNNKCNAEFKEFFKYIISQITGLTKCFFEDAYMSELGFKTTIINLRVLRDTIQTYYDLELIDNNVRSFRIMEMCNMIYMYIDDDIIYQEELTDDVARTLRRYRQLSSVYDFPSILS